MAEFQAWGAGSEVVTWGEESKGGDSRAVQSQLKDVLLCLVYLILLLILGITVINHESLTIIIKYITITNMISVVVATLFIAFECFSTILTSLFICFWTERDEEAGCRRTKAMHPIHGRSLRGAVRRASGDLGLCHSWR